MNIRFWGVRGSIAVCGEAFRRTGGNTTCVEVEHEGERLIIDGGTGLGALGATLGFAPVDATILFTHVHWDHIQGVPFFTPLFHPGSRLTIAGARTPYGTVRDALDAQMRPPQFPVGLDAFRAQLAFADVDPGTPLEIGPFRVHTAEMTHPNGVLVYRIEAGGRSFVFATDVEHGGAVDERLTRFAAGADLLVHDAQYTDAEYRSRQGWGHSTWHQAVDVGRAAGVGRLGLFHHDPTRSDDALDDIGREAALTLRAAFVAREGEEVAL